jgi:hypothetical protein
MAIFTTLAALALAGTVFEGTFAVTLLAGAFGATPTMGLSFVEASK